MSVRRGIRVPAATALAATLLAAACGGGVDKAGGTPKAKPVTLTMITTLGHEELDPFVSAVRQLSGGSVTITLAEKWHLGQPDAEQAGIRFVQAGKADLAGVPARAWDGVGVRSFDALIAPLVIDSYALQGQVLSSGLTTTMLAGVRPLGLTGLGVQAGPMRKPVGVRRDLIGPADYRGAKVAISSSAVAARTFAALAATSVPSQFQGASIAPFDGLEQQIASVEGNQYDGTARSITANVNLWPRPVVLFGGSKALGRLDAKQRAAVQQAAQQVGPAVLQQQQTDEHDTTANLCRRGRIEFKLATSQQISELKKATEPVLSWLRTDAVTRQLLDRIEALRRQASAEQPELAPSCTGGVAVAPPRPKTPGPLDGVYTQTTTAKDLLAAGSPDADPANYGTTVLVVDRGRFAFTSSSGPTVCGYGYGYWTVRGQTVELLFQGGAEQGSSAANKPGELFLYGWSLFRDTLTFSKVDGAISPENFRAKPYRRLSRTPSRSALGHRCPPPKEALT